jgi:hypothetical protein
MLHISAYVNGKEVRIPPAKSIRWFLPDTSAMMEGMQLFVPATNNAANLDLKAADIHDIAYNTGTINWRTAGTGFNRNYITMNIRAVDMRDLPSRISDKKKYKGYFYINSNSEYSRDELSKLLQKKYPYYDKVIIVGKRKKKEWSPLVSFDGSVHYDNNYSIGDTAWFEPVEIKINKLTPLDTITYAGGSSVPASPKLNNQLKKVATRYSVNIDQLGWINCDRFYRSKQKLVQYVVNLGDTASHYCTFITFDRMRSMMPGYVAGNKVIFPNVPAGENVKIISVGVKEGKTVSAMASVQLSGTTFTGLRFEPTDPSSFREQAASLDK